jgi:TP901 family phage tail tape measure protein
MALEPAGLKWMNENLPGFLDGISRANRAMGDVGGGAEKAGGGFNVLNGVVMGVASSLTTFAIDAVGKATRALAGLGASMVQTAADFESQMAILSTAVDPATASLEDLHDAALAVGADTDLVGVSASEAADAMTGLYKAGLSTEDIFGNLQGYLAGTADLSGALRAAVDLQAASELDLAGASDVVAVAMATFGLNAEDATRISDNFVQAADASVASVNDLAEGLKNVGPTAASFGFSLEDTNNALAILSTRGISGAEAGTALKSMLTNIMRPTDQVKAALGELNVELYDEQGAMLPLPQIIAQFSDALQVGTSRTVSHAAATDEMKKAAEGASEKMVELERSLVVAEAHTGMSADAMRQLMNEYVAANGSLEGFGRTQGGVTYELYKAVTAYDEAQGAIQKYKNAQGKTISEVKTLTEEQRNQYVQTLAGTYGMKAMQTLLNEGVEGWDKMAEATGAASSASTIAKTRTNTFAGALEALQGVIETVKIGIGETFLPLLTDLARQFSDFVNEYAPNLQAVFQGVANWLAVKLPEGVRLLADLWGTELQPALVSTWKYVQTRLIPVFHKIWAWLGENLPKAVAFVTEHWDAFKGALIAVGAVLAGAAIAGAVAGIASAIAALVSPIGLVVAAAAVLGAAWNTNLLGIRDTLTAFWENTARPALEQLYQWLQVNVPLAIQTLSDFWQTTLLPALQTVWNFIQTSVLPILSSVWQWLRTYIPAAVQTASDFWTNTLAPALATARDQVVNLIGTLTNVYAWLSTNIPAAVQTVSNFVTGTLLPPLQTVWDFLQNYILPVFQAVANVLSAVLGLALTAAAGFWQNVLYPALQAVWSFIQENILPIFIEVSDSAEKTVGGAVSTLSALWENTLKPALEVVWNFIQQNILPILQDLVDMVVGTVGPKLEWLKSSVIDALAGALEGIKGALSDVIDFLNNLATGISQIQLPAWLTPGSSTPFELGLRGIADVLASVVPAAMTAFSGMALAVIEQVRQAVVALDQALGNIYLVTLLALQETWLLVMTTLVTALGTVTTAVQILTAQITSLYSVTLPSLQATTLSVTATMTTAVQTVTEALAATDAAAAAAAKAMKDGFDSARDRIEDDLIPALQSLKTWLDKVKSAAEDAAAAVNGVGSSAGGAGAPGFQAGGSFIVPPGFPHDTFPLRVSSGERVIVVPRGEAAASSTTTQTVLNLNVSTRATAQAVIGEFEIMRALVS